MPDNDMPKEDLATSYYHSPVGWLRISGNDTVIESINFHDGAVTNYSVDRQIPEMLLNCTEQLIQYFNGQRRIFDFPMHQRGTPFQESTWNLLMNIPFGKTISYIQLAVRTGDPKATRAVATANGRNNLAIVVPCHRVIGANRELTGYAGGLWRKRWLLEHETKIAHGVQTLF